MSQDSTLIANSINTFNTFSNELRDRIESLIKQVLVVSGGIQTITISAFLSGSKPQLTDATIQLLKYSWYQFSASMVLCLFIMLLQILALTHVGIQQKDKLTSSKAGVEVLSTWLPLRILNWVIGLSAFFLCLSGIITISLAAANLIGA